MIEGASSLEQKILLNKKEEVDVDVQITDTGVAMDKTMLSSPQWKNFTNGKHRATLKEDQLIIHKTELPD